MNKKKLLERRGVLLSANAAILAKENATAEELASVKANQEEIRGIDAKVEALTAHEVAEARDRASAGVTAGAADEHADAGDGDAETRGRGDAGTQASVDRDRVELDPKRGFKRAQDFFLAVMRSVRTRKMDKRLLSLRSVGSEERTAGSDEQSEYNDPLGGFLIPEGFLPGPLQISAENDPIAGRVRRIPMGTPVVRVNARVDKNHTSSVSGGLRVYRRAESGTVTASKMSVEQIRLEADSLMGVSYASEELLADSPVSVAALLEAGFGQEFGAKLIDERLNGTGVGEFLGIMKSPALVTIAKESGQTADTINYTNLIKMRARCWGYSNAVWLANYDTIPQLAVMNVALGTGGVLLWIPSSREDIPDMLMGRPLIFTEYCSTLGDLGDIVLANWGEYLEGTLQGPTGAESVHVRFLENERTFRFSLRNAGAPWWSSALTPKRGSTLSPFVTLAERA